MREHGGDLHFICLEVQVLAKKWFGFKLFFITQWSHYTLFSNNSIYSRNLVVMVCKPTVTVQSQTCRALTVSSMISLPCRRVKKQLSQVIRLQPVHAVVWKCCNFYLMLPHLLHCPTVNFKAFGFNVKSQQNDQKNVERCFLLYKCRDYWHCNYLQIACNPFSRCSACRGVMTGGKVGTSPHAPSHYGGAESLRGASNNRGGRRKVPTMSQVLSSMQ